MKTKYANQNGFTVLDTILGILVASLVFGFSTATLSNNVDNYAFIARRKAALADARFAVQSLSQELLYVETADIRSISGSSITFTDKDGAETSYRISDGALYRHENQIVERVRDFDLDFYDGDGNELSAQASSIASVRRIKISLTTEDIDDEGVVTIETNVTPREFIGYTDFE